MSAPRLLTHRSAPRGSVFLLAIVILTVLLVIGVSFIERAQTAVHRAGAESRSTKSFQLAEAGVHKALWELSRPDGWLTYTGETAVPLPGGQADIAISPSPSERAIFTENVTILATGYLPGPNGGQRSACTVRVVAHKDPRLFDFAVFGSDKVTIGNGSVSILADSYSSDDGDYGEGNVSCNADVGTNSTASDAIEILPHGAVYGNVIVGAGAPSPQGCVRNRGAVMGTVQALDAPRQLPSVTSVPAGAIYLGRVRLGGTSEMVLDEGTYHLSDLDVSGSARLVCNGRVTLYIDQTGDPSSPEVSIAGNGIANTSAIPSNLILYFFDDVTAVDISGNGTLYGGVYAPRADITLNSGQVHGALVGRKVGLNGGNANVHYDVSLRDNAHPNAVVCSWEVL